VIGGKFYLVGGGSYDGVGVFTPTAELDAYDPATNSWTTRAPMPVLSAAMASATLNGKLFVAGGSDPELGTALGTLSIYDPATDMWSIKASMPTARSDAAGAAAGGLFFVIGGMVGMCCPIVSGNVEAYTP
jgi:N-acetylneuraminic acid mutarotase